MNLFRPAPRFDHGQRLEIAGAPVRLRIDGRARRVSLRVDQAAAEIIATAPNARRLSEAVDFAHAREVWIAGQMAKLPARQALAPGQVITVAGRPCQLEAVAGRARAIHDEDGALIAITAAPGDRYASAVVRLLKAEARRVLSQRTADHAAALGQPAPVVTIGDPKARWGSCAKARSGGHGAAARVGRIRYSWRIILAPANVVDYLAAHECAHLVEANHGPAFWTLVERLVAEPKAARRWLREHGPRLHAFGRG